MTGDIKDLKRITQHIEGFLDENEAGTSDNPDFHHRLQLAIEQPDDRCA
jgi:hypothetical protein